MALSEAKAAGLPDDSELMTEAASLVQARVPSFARALAVGETHRSLAPGGLMSFAFGPVASQWRSGLAPLDPHRIHVMLKRPGILLGVSEAICIWVSRDHTDMQGELGLCGLAT